MAIFRLHFKEGYPVSDGVDPRRLALMFVTERSGDFELLVPGIYVLTPSWWKKNLYDHRLTVHDDGRATYLLVPKETGVGTKEIFRGKTGEFKEGKQEIHMPKDEIVIFVSGPLKDRKTLGIFELIVYV